MRNTQDEINRVWTIQDLIKYYKEKYSWKQNALSFLSKIRDTHTTT
jgi:hypothetical protein